MRRAATFSALAALAGATIAWATVATAVGYQVEYAFPYTASPQTALIKFGGKLYGTTPAGGDAGTIFSFDPTTGAETTLYSFQYSDGAGPIGPLINVGGKLYGTTVGGGARDYGTVFSFDPTTGAETVVYSFEGGSDGSLPMAGLIDVGGVLYGTTEYGGFTPCFSGCGTVFSFNPTSGIEKTVYAFQGEGGGNYPVSGLIDVGGELYGTTLGGSSNSGTVFSVDPVTGIETLVYSFKGGSDGSIPMAGLIDVGGMLYGTAGGAGANGFGTVYSLDPATGAFNVTYAFTGGSAGAYPYASLIEVDGTLYGTTRGGTNDGDHGTVFALNPTTGAFSLLHAFKRAFKGAPDGRYPLASLLYEGRRLWGTTQGGGSGDCLKPGCGILFSVSP